MAFAIVPMTGCAESRNHHDRDRAEQYAGRNPDENLFCIIHREWVSLVGPHGFEGHRNIGYWVTLVGDGPVFKTPSSKTIRQT